MKYSFKLSSKSQSFLDGLNKKESLRIIKKLEQIEENPFRYIKHYEGTGYKLRVGDYRAILDIDFERKILFVRVLDKRGRIYKK